MRRDSKKSTSSQSRSNDNNAKTKTSAHTTNPVLYGKTMLFILLVSAPLGMMLDNFHSLFGVLSYTPIGYPITLAYHDRALLKTASFVPFIFGFAGFAIASAGLAFDDAFNISDRIRFPSWSKALLSLALFCAQYYLSSVLHEQDVSLESIHAILFVVAIFGYMLFDMTISGFVLGIGASMAGPLVEITLINVFHLYSYRNADRFGICTWIVWLFFLSGPVVLNLARAMNAHQRKIKQ